MTYRDETAGDTRVRVPHSSGLSIWLLVPNDNMGSLPELTFLSRLLHPSGVRQLRPFRCGSFHRSRPLRAFAGVVGGGCGVHRSYRALTRSTAASGSSLE